MAEKAITSVNRSLRHLKPGDQVFVVCQHDINRGKLPCEYSPEVLRVGRKYGYIEDGAFCLDTGESHHPDYPNARVNSAGFDVYVSQEAYRKLQFEIQDRARLAERLFFSDHGGIELPPDAVSKIHDILDEYGTGESSN